MMRLPMKMKMQDKMWRVEQVLGQCGLYDVADVVVGDNSFTGGGLSGGQKRRLCIALQLLDLPSVIFLDEPTSGLDSASSLELLETLHSLTLSGRLVVVTIHQPRIEIFHMFDAILLLCEGQVAYFGSPIIAPTMIAEALKDSGQTFDASNPADSIMDVLTNPEAQKSILDYYLQSGEIQAINRAIARARRHPQKTLSMKFQKQTSSIQNRLLALDGRTSASQTLSQSFYFPLIYLLYGLALGTCYWKTHKGVLLMSCYMVFSCASQLFLASVIHGHLHKAFALFELEKADGIGHSTELILHVFIRTFSKSSIPLIMSCAIIYLCSIQDYVLWKFCLTTLIHLQLNQAWIAIIVFTACCLLHAALFDPRITAVSAVERASGSPSGLKYCFNQLMIDFQNDTFHSPVTKLALSIAVAGFAGGFLVPEPQMPWIYYWLFYINPTHWAYSGMMKVLITDVTFQCKWDSPLECQTTTGIVVLSEFGFSERNPYVSMFILLVMLITFLLASVVVLEIKYSKRKWDKRKKNYWQAITQSIRSCYNSLFENYYRKKREAEEEERNRLFKLVEHQYQYKGEHYAQTPQEGVNEKDGGRPKRPTYEPLKDHSQVDGEWVDRKRSNTVNSNDFNDETYDETENSSNDEDIDPTLELRQPRPKLSFQQNSFTSVLTKLQSGLTSKTNSFDNNNDSPSMNGDTVPFRSSAKKKRQWRKAFAQRRKTFTGFIEEGVEEESKPYSRWRPKSMLLPDRHHDINIDNKLHRTKSNMTEHSKLSRTNKPSPVRERLLLSAENLKSKVTRPPPL
ncbi:ABC transporter G family member 22-like [Clytia hemisphaerica]|uniref:ABC transporter G family member 22-like n=1 Tax=Clytia hemisphaerica TaxID=252671 RepID=UPI0034D41B35